MYGTSLVTVKKFCDLSGYSEDDILKKIVSGEWEEGSMWYKAPDGMIFIHLDEFENWIFENGSINE